MANIRAFGLTDIAQEAKSTIKKGKDFFYGKQEWKADVDDFGMNTWHVIHSCISNHMMSTPSASTIPVNPSTMYHPLS